MICSICNLKNVKLQNEIEKLLDANKGYLSDADKKELKTKYPNDVEAIQSIKESDCMLHWNFHQAANYIDDINDSNNVSDEPMSSLARDINKNEAGVLYDLMNKQAATFNCLTNKINKALLDEEDTSLSIISPNVLEFYRDLGNSIRATVKELRELNTDLNGSKGGTFEGLKALAHALAPNVNITTSNNTATNDAPGEMRVADPEELTTDKFDY